MWDRVQFNPLLGFDFFRLSNWPFHAIYSDWNAEAMYFCFVYFFSSHCIFCFEGTPCSLSCSSHFSSIKEINESWVSIKKLKVKWKFQLGWGALIRHGLISPKTKQMSSEHSIRLTLYNDCSSPTSEQVLLPIHHNSGISLVWTTHPFLLVPQLIGHPNKH